MRRFLACLTGLLLIPGSFAAEPDELAQQVERLKLQSVTLARDIWMLEQQSDAEQGRVVVFLSVDSRLQDTPRQIELKLGDQTIARHEYTGAEIEALAKGGAHRVYASALETGRHVLEARLSLQGEAGRTRQTAKLSFRSGDTPKTIELRLEPAGAGLAELRVREWD